MNIEIHPRIEEQHPEIKNEDVLEAWQNFVIGGTRTKSKNYPEVLRIGYDQKGRELEMVGTLTENGWLVYHAMTPPSKKTTVEIEKIRRNLQ